MSSILDALNKLEEEKMSQSKDSSEDFYPLSPEDAAANLLGHRSGHRESTALRLWIPLMAAVFFCVVIAAMSAGVGVWLVMKPDRTETAATEDKRVASELYTYTLPLSAQAEAAEAPAHTSEMIAQQEAPPAAPVKKPEPPAVTPAVVPAAKKEPVPVPKPAVVQEATPPPAPKQAVEVLRLPEVKTETPPVTPPPAPPAMPPPVTTPAIEEHPLPDVNELMQVARAEVVEPEPVQTQVPAFTPDPSPPPPPPPATRTASQEVNMKNLPRLSMHEREMLGLDNIRLNVLRPADKQQPDALAIINLKKVYVGEVIPGTPARLIAVESNAIGVEVQSGGATKQYQIPR